MTALRPFARPVVLLWLCAFALFLAAPMEAFAKRDMVNGNDSLEGDPGDSMDALGGSGGTIGDAGSSGMSASPTKPHPRFYDPIVIGAITPIFIVYGATTLYFEIIFVLPNWGSGGGER